MKLCLTHFLLFLSISFASFGQGKTKSLHTAWPKEYNWKEISSKEDSILHTTEWISEKDSAESKTLKAFSTTYKSVKKVPLGVAMSMMQDQIKINAPKAVATPLERDDKAKNPWILFKIEIPKFKNDKNPESQLYYIVQGEQNLYANYVITKEKTLSPEFLQQWSKVFKESELVHRD